MRIKYLRNVSSPPWQVGNVDDVKDVDVRTGRILIEGGFAEEVKTNKKKTKE